MKALGHCGARAMEEQVHPLDLRGIASVASSMAHDGDIGGARQLIDQAYKDAHRHGGQRADVGFYMLLGMRAAFDAVVGYRDHLRSKRASARSTAALRRSLRLA